MNGNFWYYGHWPEEVGHTRSVDITSRRTAAAPEIELVLQPDNLVSVAQESNTLAHSNVASFVTEHGFDSLFQ
jgi:hypothetical protein